VLDAKLALTGGDYVKVELHLSKFFQAVLDFFNEKISFQQNERVLELQRIKNRLYGRYPVSGCQRRHAESRRK